MLGPAPKEFCYGIYFSKFRKWVEVCGTRQESDGTEFLVMKCLGCGCELPYNWLSKKPDQSWTGEFGKQVKRGLTSNRTHKKCRSKIEQRNEASMLQQPSNALTTVSSSSSSEFAHVINNIQQQNVQNIVIVNLPAVTRTGSTSNPLMCSDIPYPDAKTVKQLLNHPESAISEFVYKRFLNVASPSITAPDASNTKLKVVHRDNFGNHWVDVPLDATVDNLVYNTLDSLDDTFDAMKHSEFKD